MRTRTYDQMNHEEKVRFFATGRCTAGKVSQLNKGDIKDFWLPKVRGMFVRLKKRRFKSPEAALKEAQKFREVMRKQLLAHRRSL